MCGKSSESIRCAKRRVRLDLQQSINTAERHSSEQACTATATAQICVSWSGDERSDAAATGANGSVRVACVVTLSLVEHSLPQKVRRSLSERERASTQLEQRRQAIGCVRRVLQHSSGLRSSLCWLHCCLAGVASAATAGALVCPPALCDARARREARADPSLGDRRNCYLNTKTKATEEPSHKNRSAV